METKTDSASISPSPRKPWGAWGIAILLFAVVLGGVLRLYDIGGPSFADDEVFKVNAVKAYRAGHWTLTGDDEHPLLLKLLIYSTYQVRDVWNAHVAKGHQTLELGLESATRGPNAVIGALLALVLAFLGRELFSRRVGLVAALLWSVDLIAIGYNRIAKEDTLIAFFLTLAFYFVVRAKRTAEAGEEKRSRRYEVATAMAIGCLCASKYFFHMTWPIPIFYFWSRRAGGTAWHVSGKRWTALIGIAFATFLAINPTVLHPDNLHYIRSYMGHHTIYTHGYLFLDKLYVNNAFEALKGGGTPWYYYFVYLGVKLAPPVLAVAVLGFALTLRDRKSDGARVILSWLTIWFLVHAILSGAKWGRFMTHLMPPVVLLGALGLDRLSRYASHKLRELGAVPARASALVVVFAALVALPALRADIEAAPHYRMHLNLFGGGLERLRHYFPHCDLYDVGVREAMLYICARAEQGAQVRTDAPVVGAHYAEVCGRPDLKVSPLADTQGECEAGRPCYQILQIGRTYFETKGIFEELHAQRAPDAVVRARGVNVAEIYGPDKLGGLEVAIGNAGEASKAGSSFVGPAPDVSALAADIHKMRHPYRLAPMIDWIGVRQDRESIVEEIATPGGAQPE